MDNLLEMIRLRVREDYERYLRERREGSPFVRAIRKAIEEGKAENSPTPGQVTSISTYSNAKGVERDRVGE